MAEVVWAVPAVEYERNPRRKYHCYRKRLTSSKNVIWVRMCAVTGASERRQLYTWSSPPRSKRCTHCHELARAVAEVA